MMRLSQGNPPPPLLPEPNKPLQTSWIKLLVGSSVDRVYEAGFRLYRCAEGTMPPRRLSCTSKYKIQASDEGQLIAALRSSCHLEVGCHEFSLKLGFFRLALLHLFYLLATKVNRTKMQKTKTLRSIRRCPTCDRPLGFVLNVFIFVSYVLSAGQALCLNGFCHGATLIVGGSCPFLDQCSFDQVLSSGQPPCCPEVPYVPSHLFPCQDVFHSERAFNGGFFLSHRRLVGRWQYDCDVLHVSAGADSAGDSDDNDPIERFSDDMLELSHSSPSSSRSDVDISSLPSPSASSHAAASDGCCSSSEHTLPSTGIVRRHDFYGIFSQPDHDSLDWGSPLVSFLSRLMARLLGILLALMLFHFLPMMVGYFSMEEGVPLCTLNFLLLPGTTSTRGSFDIMRSVMMRLISLSPLKNMRLCIRRD